MCSYWQDDIPIFDHKNIKGHAVRAAYLIAYDGRASETGDQHLLAMLNRVWRNTTERNMYLTGGIGPSSHNEGFTEDYDLPNATAYQETCATIALAQWNHRLALLYGEAKIRGHRGARSLQRRTRAASRRRHKVLLREPAGESRQPPSLAVVRLRLLPAERGSHAGVPRRLRLRHQRQSALGKRLHSGSAKTKVGSAPWNWT